MNLKIPVLPIRHSQAQVRSEKGTDTLEFCKIDDEKNARKFYFFTVGSESKRLER